MANYEEFFKKENTIALVGASRDLSKYSHTILLHFQHANYKIIPINPNERDIEGLDCYATLDEVKDEIDVVVMMISPKKSIKILESVKNIKIKKTLSNYNYILDIDINIITLADLVVKLNKFSKIEDLEVKSLPITESIRYLYKSKN